MSLSAMITGGLFTLTTVTFTLNVSDNGGVPLSVTMNVTFGMSMLSFVAQLNDGTKVNL